MEVALCETDILHCWVVQEIEFTLPKSVDADIAKRAVNIHQYLQTLIKNGPHLAATITGSAHIVTNLMKGSSPFIDSTISFVQRKRIARDAGKLLSKEIMLLTPTVIISISVTSCFTPIVISSVKSRTPSFLTM